MPFGISTPSITRSTLKSVFSRYTAPSGFISLTWKSFILPAQNLPFASTTPSLNRILSCRVPRPPSFSFLSPFPSPASSSALNTSFIHFSSAVSVSRTANPFLPATMHLVEKCEGVMGSEMSAVMPTE